MLEWLYIFILFGWSAGFGLLFLRESNKDTDEKLVIHFGGIIILLIVGLIFFPQLFSDF